MIKDDITPAMTRSHANKSVILVVDDNPDNLGILFDLLSDQGFEILVAEDGESALQQTEYAQPNLILLDILLPDMDGFATCERLKARPETKDIPVIFMSALTDTVDKVKGLQLGAVDYITKPFQHQEVLARVNTHLTLQRLKTRLKESEQRLSRIVAFAMDAILTLDQTGRVTLFNRAAERVFRCTASAAIGQSFAKFFAEEACKVLADYLQEGQSGQPAKPARWLPEGHTAVRADGEAFPIEATLSYAQANGQALYTIILRDIEERKKAEAERQKLRGLNIYLEEELRSAQAAEEFVGSSRSLREVMRNVQQVAGTEATVLITGETGTGKELIARAVHRLSARKDMVLVKLNCATIPSGLVESELFGHEKGAFTGALARKIGRFELANGGTLFLDEVGELSLDLQAKLLRVLQEGEFERLGSNRTTTVDVRIVAATNRDLAKRVTEGEFRADLFYRLNVFPIPLPPLRERRDDILLLVEHFVKRYATKYGKQIETVPERMVTALQTYDWPGNVRELQHVIERAVILTQGFQLAFDEGFLHAKATEISPRVITLAEVERKHIRRILEDTGWRVSGKEGAAELLGLKPTTLESRMKKLGIKRGI
jgi:formate hydrogenlyase transcriptional activator